MIIKNEIFNINNKVIMDHTELFKYSKLSQNLTTKINKSEKKKNGIFFTPPETVHRNIKLLEPL